MRNRNKILCFFFFLSSCHYAYSQNINLEIEFVGNSAEISNYKKIKKNAIVVDNSLDYQTNIPGIYAIGDVKTYPGKLKLILCGFHEATLMCQSAYQIINPGKKNIFKYTTVSGIDGFDGTRKEAKKPVVQAINE